MPSTPTAYLALLLAAIVAGAGWNLGTALMGTLIGWMRREKP